MENKKSLKSSSTKARKKLMEKPLNPKISLSHYFSWSSLSYAMRKISYTLYRKRPLCWHEVPMLSSQISEIDQNLKKKIKNHS